MKKFFTDGMTVLFQGDSVTDCDRDRSKTEGIESLGNGYPKIFKQVYDTLFPENKVKFVNKGVSGNRTCHLLERYDEDFKGINPDFISIMIGINNTWRNFDGQEDYCSAERFGKEYEELLTKIKADMPDAKILIIEQFAFTAHPERNTWQEDVDGKRNETRRLAEKYADWFIPMYDIMTEASKTEFDMYALSADGVHPAPLGHSLIATEIFKTLEIV